MLSPSPAHWIANGIYEILAEKPTGFLDYLPTLSCGCMQPGSRPDIRITECAAIP
jgi:hypothetical protein